ncbi:putative cytochrome P450 [Hypoxylon trugodes]|uniref:putative cytochrome P450 n=1 Tax=Hypoxylon trugodes TaxID=326681 RepID=UPI00219252F4|nr:putative cytochrome P450 [Hypoxylon trugodes]KAI1386920.1 putative cytochrome P450 [Hypoxylon trugodes]
MLASEWSWTGRLVAALLAILAYPILQAIYNLYFHPLRKIPGPRTWSASRLPFVCALLRGTIIQDIEKLHRKYGPVLRIAPDEVTFAQEEAYNDIFQPRSNNQPPFPKDPVWWEFPPGLPVSLMNAFDPESHARIRRQLAPGFTMRALRAQEPILQRYVNLLVERLHERAKGKGAVIDMMPWFNFTTFDIFGDLGFGESFGCLENSQYHSWVAMLFRTVKASAYGTAAKFYPLVQFILMKCMPPSLKKVQENHYQQIVDKVHRRMNWELERPDIMSHVIRGNDEKKGLPIGEINSTFMVLTTAGSETTATTLCGTLNYLVHNGDKLDILTREVRMRFQSESEITLDALQNLPYLNAVLNEGLRLCPPIPWMLPRRVPAGGETVCGIWLPEGTPVSIQAYTIHRDPANFHLASSFLPERWLPEASADVSSVFYNDKRQAVQPFSVGPRACLGKNLAMAEMRLILAKLLWTLDFEAVEGKKVVWEELKTFAIVEKKPIEVKVQVRDDLPGL